MYFKYPPPFSNASQWVYSKVCHLCICASSLTDASLGRGKNACQRQNGGEDIGRASAVNAGPSPVPNDPPVPTTFHPIPSPSLLAYCHLLTDTGRLPSTSSALPPHATTLRKWPLVARSTFRWQTFLL